MAARKRKHPPTTSRGTTLPSPLEPATLPPEPGRVPGFETLCRWVLLPAIVAAMAVCLTCVPVRDPDLWFHMAHGRYVVEHHSFPPGDVFSYTSPGREWISTGWLGGVVLYWLWESVGRGVSAGGLVLFVALQVVGAYLAVYGAATRRRVEAAMVPLLLLGLAAGCLRFHPRPDLCSQVLFVILLLLLISTEQVQPRRVSKPDPRRRPAFASLAIPGQRRLWALPPLMILWANLHAGFVVGIVVVGIYGAYRLMRGVRRRDRDDLHALLPCALTGVAWVVNPYGVSILKLPFKIRQFLDLTGMVYEWMPLIGPPGRRLPTTIYLAAALLLALCALALLLRNTRVPLWQWGVVVFLVVISWKARRQLSLATLGLTILVLPHLGGLQRQLTRWRPAPLVAALVVACGAIFFAGRFAGVRGWPSGGLEPRAYPLETTKFLEQFRPPANLFNSFHFGGYLMYHLGPETKVFIDGRIDTYDPKVWEDDRDIEAGTLPLDEAIRKYHLNTFVLESRPLFDPGQMFQRLSERPDFRLVCRDTISGVFVRVAPETEDFFRQLPASGS